MKDFKNLSWAEKKLIACAARGRQCVLGESAPDAPTRSNAVRPELVRFLALGGDENAPVHEKGVWLEGAHIGAIPNGEEPQPLDLTGATLPVGLWLFACRFDAEILMRGCRGRSIGLDGSAFPGLWGDGLVMDGNLHFRRVKVTGEVRLLGARIAGGLACNGGQFKNANGDALSCDGAEIAGGVFLNETFHATGDVRLLGTKIGDNLACAGGRFENSDGDALSCDRAEIGGSVFLDGTFHSIGVVRLLGAKISGNLNCRGGQFENADGDALSCERAEIGGGLFFQSVRPVRGNVSFAHACVATLVDDLPSWPEKALYLDGFRYERIAASSLLDAKSRIAWLDRQTPAFLVGETFALQPWMQLAKVLREQGHFRDAAEVDIAAKIACALRAE